MFYNPLKRRHFLQGLGASLALPMLPSLMSKAHAALGEDKSFIYIAEPHGGINLEHMYPSRTPGNEQVLYSGNASEGLDHRTRMEPLENFLSTRSDGLFPTNEQEFSSVLGSYLNPHLSKINVLRGFDLMFYAAHHQGCYLGNFDGRIKDDDVTDRYAHFPAMETIDQVMASSPSFYSSTPALPTMNISQHFGISYKRISGQIVRLTKDTGTDRIINALLGAGSPVSSTQEMTQYLNRIHGDYQQLMNGSHGAARRLSSQDRIRLDEHLSLLNDLTDRIEAQGGLSCSAEAGSLSAIDWEYTDSMSMSSRAARWDIITDTIVAAIKCGASRIATISPNTHVPDDPAWGHDYHSSIAHRGLGSNSSIALTAMVENTRVTGEHVFAALARKLDVERGDGSTYLDNSLIGWMHEAGPITHNPYEMFVVTAGSAGGFFNTGNYADFRNLSNNAFGIVDYSRDLNNPSRPGIPYNRWIYTMLKAMGIPDQEFARAGMTGYGVDHADNLVEHGHRAWPTRVISDMGQLMPRVIA